ncbi:ester cyclase [Ruegeria arenilitoris]|uniref:ester cyclase n=1 Tax=Ruegeria arenilitoris TaxID=1173585 RepID=UPI00147ED582|nr:ester cyclase [Ruegeria arenilitoris]
MKPTTLMTTLAATALFAVPAFAEEAALKARIAELEAQLAEYEAEKELEAANVALYDKMDLEAFTAHDMETIGEIHAHDVKVIFPDGSLTEGMFPAHEAQIDWLFTTFSDITIPEHPIKFGSGEWTAGLSVTKGTWDSPMHLPDGRVLEPSGKPFEHNVVTLVRWEAGQIAEEYVMWDNFDLYAQIGALEGMICK